MRPWQAPKIPSPNKKPLTDTGPAFFFLIQERIQRFFYGAFTVNVRAGDSSSLAVFAVIS
jgi:hypothetical protein